MAFPLDPQLTMPFEWLWNLLTWLSSAKSTEQTVLREEHKDLRDERDALRTDLKEVMHAYQLLNKELRQELSELRVQVEALEDALDAEKTQHRECRQKLAAHEEEIFKLKIQVRELAINQRQSDG